MDCPADCPTDDPLDSKTTFTFEMGVYNEKSPCSLKTARTFRSLGENDR